LKNWNGNTPLQYAQTIAGSRANYEKIVEALKVYNNTVVEESELDRNKEKKLMELAKLKKMEEDMLKKKAVKNVKGEKQSELDRKLKAKEFKEKKLEFARIKTIDDVKVKTPNYELLTLFEQFTTTKIQHETELENLRAQVKLLSERLDKYETAFTNLQNNNNNNTASISGTDHTE